MKFFKKFMRNDGTISSAACIVGRTGRISPIKEKTPWNRVNFGRTQDNTAGKKIGAIWRDFARYAGGGRREVLGKKSNMIGDVAQVKKLARRFFCADSSRLTVAAAWKKTESRAKVHAI